MWEISLLIIAVALLLLVIFAIPTLLQLRATAKSIETSSNAFNQKIPEILENVHHLTSDVVETTSGIKGQIQNASGIVSSVQEMVNNVVDLEKSIRREVESPLVDLVGTVNAFVKGFRIFFDTLRAK